MISRWFAHPDTRDLDIDDPRLISLRRRLVREKVFLTRIYREWYAALIDTLPPGEGRILELGAGGGFLDEMLPGLITSELQPCQNVRVILDGQALPFSDASLRAVLMVDVLHHMPEARRFLKEAARCVRPGGRVAMVEPWVSAWSSLVYTQLHHEPFEPKAAAWEFPPGGPLSASNMALPWIMFVRDRAQFDREFPEWKVVSVRPFMPFRYLLSGGVSLRSLMPGWTFGWWRMLEWVLSPLNGALGMFAQIVLERREAGESQ